MDRAKMSASARRQNTVLVELEKNAEEDVRKRFTRKFFSVDILKGLLEQTTDEVFCVGDTDKVGTFEVTFWNMRACQVFMEEWNKRRGEPLLASLRMTPLFSRGYVPLIVRMYNPFVEERYILAFLGKYCAEVFGGTPVRDEAGFWTGKRRYTVRLKDDEKRPGEPVHVPNMVVIGSERGIVTYKDQPLQCRECGGMGHTRYQCTEGGRCRRCHSDAHMAYECRAPKTCTLCGSTDHLYRVCPTVPFSYAAAVDGTTKRTVTAHGQDGGAREEQREPHVPDGGRERPPVVEGDAAEGPHPESLVPPVVRRPSDPRLPRPPLELDGVGVGGAGGVAGASETAMEDSGCSAIMDVNSDDAFYSPESESEPEPEPGALRRKRECEEGDDMGRKERKVGPESEDASQAAPDSQNWAERIEKEEAGGSQVYGPEGVVSEGEDMKVLLGQLVSLNPPARSSKESGGPVSGGGPEREEVRVEETPLGEGATAGGVERAEARGSKASTTQGVGPEARERGRSHTPGRVERGGSRSVTSRSGSRGRQRSAPGNGRVSAQACEGRGGGGEEVEEPKRSAKTGNVRGKDSSK